MIDGHEIIAEALVDFGAVATVNGLPLPIIPYLEGFPRAEGELINRAGPYAMASTAGVAAVGAETGDTLTYDSVDYTIVVIDPGTTGEVILGLEVDL